MNRFGKITALFVLVLLVGGVQAARAVTTGASIIGTVQTPGADTIDAAKIEALGMSKTYQTLSDKAGRFALKDLVPGTYVLRTSARSYVTTESNPLSLASGETREVRVILQPISTTNINTIGRVSVVGHPTLNTSSASSFSVTNSQFLNQGATQVQNALETYPGITLDRPNGVTSAPGAVTTFTIRGAGAFGGGNDGSANTGYEILVLQDGEPIRNGQYGDFDASALTPAIYSRVEVIKGVGGSSIFGANTVGGTINLVTRDPARTEGGEFIQTVGGYGTTDWNLSETNTIGKFGYLLNLHRYGTDGYIPPSFVGLFNFGQVISHATQPST